MTLVTFHDLIRISEMCLTRNSVKMYYPSVEKLAYFHLSPN